MGRTVGIFGLGLIGMALADRLLSAGHGVVGHDIDPARGALLEEKGGRVAPPEELWQCDILLSAVFDTDQLAGVVAGARDGTGRVLVSMSTCDPDRVAELADIARAKSIVLVESPISGTSRQVRQGTALLLLAGDPAGWMPSRRSPTRSRPPAKGWERSATATAPSWRSTAFSA